MTAMAKLSVEDIQGDGEMTKQRKTSNPQSKRKIEEAKTLNPSSPQNETREEKDVVTMETDSLDCSICFNPLYPPINQVPFFFSYIFWRFISFFLWFV